MKRIIGLIPATSIVITNMIGTGILITPGLLCSYINRPGQLLAVWVLGGLIALLGAIVYGQLGSLMPHSGGEFYYLSKLYHPVIGLTAGWVSIIAGFSGPIALAALAFSKYLLNFNSSIGSNNLSSWQFEEKAISVLLIIFLSGFHYLRKRTALNFQLILTILLILFLLTISYLCIKLGKITFPVVHSFTEISSGNGLGMAVLLSIYSYTGWNAGCYFAGEIRNPRRNLPLSLFAGVTIVMILYIVVNYGLLKILGPERLSGQIDYLGSLGREINGKFGQQFISVTVLMILMASISSMIFASARIPVMNLHPLNRKKSNLLTDSSETLLLQMSISLIFVLTSGLQQLLICLTIILSVSSILTSLGVYLLPWYKFKVSLTREWVVKISALLFAGILLLLIINSFSMDLRSSLTGLILLPVGPIVYFLARKFLEGQALEKIKSR